MDNDEILASVFAHALGIMLDDKSGVVIDVQSTDNHTHKLLVVRYDTQIMVIAIDHRTDLKNGDIVTGWIPDEIGRLH